MSTANDIPTTAAAPADTSMPAGHPILFFDGECNLCNSSVQFIIRHDKKKRFLFAPLQSAAGQRAKHVVGEVDSIVLYNNGRYFTKSDAALGVARMLSGLWPVLYAGIILPRFIRDGIYEYISRNRYKWYGKRSECMIPTPELKARFIS